MNIHAIWIMIVVLASGIMAMIGYNDGYRNGQIDAITGKVYYELQVHPELNTTWERNHHKK